MILSTHAIVGASIESLIPNHPMLAFASGMASHFVNICDSLGIIRFARSH